MKWRVPFFDLRLDQDDKSAVMDALDSNWLTSGPRIESFEEEFANIFDNESFAIAVSSATAALHLSLVALRLKPGDEVLVPSLTFVACANAIRYVGATPVFVDINSENDWNLSVADVARKITPRTRAIMPVHFAGYACDITAIVKLAGENEIGIIEDCSHAPMAQHMGKLVGTFGNTGCFSFFSNKNMTTAEGGMVLTRCPEVAAKIRSLRSHGITSTTYQRFKGHSFGYDVDLLGYNYRLDEIRAALGKSQLSKLRENNIKREALVAIYREQLQLKIPDIISPFHDHNDVSSFHIFPILLPEKIELTREEVMHKMANIGIQTSIHYEPIHKFSSYKTFKANVPNLERIASRIMTLPLFASMTNDDIDLVISTLAKILRR
ncbi:DegT/DnrJ/EryC1/StrS family aminotransferase [Alphaproteobacteria bacterium]|nr:DegT/DnrJ/EryC1/StrS family aminotransferase [Alphaproteobacteria bacterium]